MQSHVLCDAHYNYVLCTDVISPTNLLSICKDQLSSLKIQEIEKLSKKLMVEEEFAAVSHAHVDKVLFHVLYSWHCKNPTATKRGLALMMWECGLYQHAIYLDSTCEF